MADVTHCDACGSASSSSFTAESDAPGGWSKLLLLVMPAHPVDDSGALRLVLCPPCTDRLLASVSDLGSKLASRYDVLIAERRAKLGRPGAE